jgi:hypothetical protein
MLAVQARSGRLHSVLLVARAAAVLLLAAAAAASLCIALSVPCQHRQRIGMSGFSLGDQCLSD